MGSVFADSGAGIAIIQCARCHHQNYFVDEVEVLKLGSATKLADAWRMIANALGTVAPAIATLGIWDLSVAYSTFKKVLENTHRQQAQQSNILYNPLYISGKKDLETEHEELKKEVEEHTKRHSKEKGLDKKAEGERLPGASEEHENSDEQFSYQTHEVSYDAPVQVSEAMISISHLEDFLRSIVPHVVKFGLDKRDGNILKALGVLGSVIREAKKTHRISSEEASTDYTRTYLQG
jgi:hypothetical protein